MKPLRSTERDDRMGVGGKCYNTVLVFTVFYSFFREVDTLLSPRVPSDTLGGLAGSLLSPSVPRDRRVILATARLCPTTSLSPTVPSGCCSACGRHSIKLSILSYFTKIWTFLFLDINGKRFSFQKDFLTNLSVSEFTEKFLVSFEIVVIEEIVKAWSSVGTGDKDGSDHQNKTH